MNEFFEHIGSDLREIGERIKQGVTKLTGKETQTTATVNGGSVIVVAPKSNYEMNLVPEIEMQMIKAQKMRNLVLFICIVVSSVAVGAVVVLFGVKSGQDIAIASQDRRLDLMSEKLNSFDELESLLTIQGQLEGISGILDKKKVVSRVFGALGVMLPQGADSVRLSELNLDLSNNLLQIEGQADAHTDPLIDYRVLESFKKGVSLTRYDYGDYVDADGNVIPTYCISETDEDGNAYKLGDNYYAWWDLTIEGCEASQRGGESVDGARFVYSSTAEVEKGIKGEEPTIVVVCDGTTGRCEEKPIDGVEENVDPEVPVEESPEGDENSEDSEEDEKNKIIPLRVRVWRTPQFTSWYDTGKMSLAGAINNVEHFQSACYAYTGIEIASSSNSQSGGSSSGDAKDKDKKSNVKWTSTNDCMLAPEGLENVESANARDQSDNLVLKFSGNIILAPEFFSFKNKHMIAVGPYGQNVTDSYVQIGDMFTQEAKECAPDDTACLNNAVNRGDA